MPDNQPAPFSTPSPSSRSSSEVVEAEYVEVAEPKETKAAREVRAQPRASALVARVVPGSGSRRRTWSSRARGRTALAPHPACLCGRPSITSARVLGVAYVPLCRRCTAIGKLALVLFGR
jgi:hypothetical protein